VVLERLPLRIGPLLVQACHEAPRGIAAAAAVVVVEDDRYRVLGAEPEFRDPGPVHPIRIHTALVDLAPAEPGTVVVGPDGRRWYAVVHDLDLEPSARPEWLDAALREVLRLARQRGVRALVLPPLGAVHGGVSLATALERIARALWHHAELAAEAAGSGPLERVWLRVPEHASEEEARSALRRPGSTGGGP
jgi:hypothetical protein